SGARPAIRLDAAAEWDTADPPDLRPLRPDDGVRAPGRALPRPGQRRGPAVAHAGFANALRGTGRPAEERRARGGLCHRGRLGRATPEVRRLLRQVRHTIAAMMGPDRQELR